VIGTIADGGILDGLAIGVLHAAFDGDPTGQLVLHGSAVEGRKVFIGFHVDDPPQSQTRRVTGPNLDHVEVWRKSVVLPAAICVRQHRNGWQQHLPRAGIPLIGIDHDPRFGEWLAVLIHDLAADGYSFFEKKRKRSGQGGCISGVRLNDGVRISFQRGPNANAVDGLGAHGDNRLAGVVGAA
jgi:hypothetical protein